MFISKIKNIYITNNILINNILGTYTIKGVSLLISFFSLPAYITYFSNNIVLGLWFTLLSILQWILTFDLGIGNGLRNKLVPLLVSNDYQKIKEYISSAYIILGICSFTIIIIGSTLIVQGAWNDILNIPVNIISKDSLKLVILLIFVGIILQFFLNIINSVLFAMQKIAVSNLISLFSSIIILLYVVFFKTGDIEKDITYLAIVNIFTINIPLLITTIIVFSTLLKKSIPSIRCFNKEFAVNVLKIGGAFFWIQLALLFINSTNEMLITWFYGTEYVVEYQVYFRLFYLAVTLFSLITNPLWSAISDAYVRKRYTWIINLNRRINLLVLIVIIGNVILLILSQSAIDIWLGQHSFKINYMYGSIFVIFSAISMYNMAASCFANGLGNLKLQLILFSIAAIFKIPIIVLLSYYINDWVCIIIVNIIVLSPYAIIQQRALNNFYKKYLRITS